MLGQRNTHESQYLGDTVVPPLIKFSHRLTKLYHAPAKATRCFPAVLAYLSWSIPTFAPGYSLGPSRLDLAWRYITYWRFINRSILLSFEPQIFEDRLAKDS